MKRPRSIAWAIPVAALALAVVGLPALAVTETGAERSVKEGLGIVDEGCVPATAESPGWRAVSSLPRERDDTRAVSLRGRIYIAGGITAITRTTRRNVRGVKEL